MMVRDGAIPPFVQASAGISTGIGIAVVLGLLPEETARRAFYYCTFIPIVKRYGRWDRS